MREEFKRRQQHAIVAALRQTNGKIYGPGGAVELLGIKPTTQASRIAVLGPETKDADLTTPRVTTDG